MTYYMWSGYHIIIIILVNIVYISIHKSVSRYTESSFFCDENTDVLAFFFFFWLICIFKFIFQGDVLDKVFFFLRITSSRDFQKSPRPINPFFTLYHRISPHQNSSLFLQ